MNLCKSQIDKIDAYLLQHGLEINDVREDVLDHLCCQIEIALEEGKAFEEAFDEVQEIFSPEEISTIQQDTIYFLTFKPSIAMVKGMFISAYVALAFYLLAIGFNGFFFYFLGAELATMLKVLMKLASVSVLCFGFLPLLFRFGYKRFTHNLLHAE